MPYHPSQLHISFVLPSVNHVSDRRNLGTAFSSSPVQSAILSPFLVRLCLHSKLTSRASKASPSRNTFGFISKLFHSSAHLVCMHFMFAATPMTGTGQGMTDCIFFHAATWSSILHVVCVSSLFG